MCLLVVISRLSPEFPLVVAANRDERFDRPAIAMTLLSKDNPRILGGRDEQAGGTWLAVNERGVTAGLTNRRDPSGRDPSKRSRGELPLALTRCSSARHAVDEFVPRFRPIDYNPAWLLVGDRDSLFAVDMSQGRTPSVKELGPGAYVLENRPFGAPSVKVDAVHAHLKGIKTLTGTELVEGLFAILADHEIPGNDADVPAGAHCSLEPDASEPRGSEDRGANASNLAALNAACVHTEHYGTRWSAVILTPRDPSSPPAFWYTDGPSCCSERHLAPWD